MCVRMCARDETEYDNMDDKKYAHSAPKKKKKLKMMDVYLTLLLKLIGFLISVLVKQTTWYQ